MRIAIACLSCGHRSSVTESELAAFGLGPGTSLVVLSKRLVCKECGSRSVQTQRYLDDEGAPSIVPDDRTKE